jgi:hypothetical protein
MEASSLRGAQRAERGRAPSAEATPLTPRELAWIAALPCAALTLLAVVLLGPVVGDALLGPGSEDLWPREASIYVFGQPEPAKRGGFVLALLGPLLLAAVVLAGRARPVRMRPRTTRVLVAASQLLLVAGVILATLYQHVDYRFAPENLRLFTVPTLVVALAMPLTLLALPRLPQLARRLPRLRRDGRELAATCWAVAALATAVWLLSAVTSDGSIADGPFTDLPPWAMGDTYAILNGRTPLVDFHPIYGHLWAYVAAVPMAVLAADITTFAIVVTSVSALALLAIYALFRRVVGSPLAALGLYLPFMATSLFVLSTDLPWRMSNAAIYSVWPMRYAGPLLLAWLTARHLDGAAPRRPWPLFAAGGLVVVNNLEFGLGALAGTALALLCVPSSRSWRGLRRLAVHAVGGVLAAVALIALLTLVRAGALPSFGLLLEFPRAFGVLGLAALRMEPIGFHLAIYATFAAALAVAAVRIARRDDGLVLTGTLAWSGLFGLAAGSYFIGRSDLLKLTALLPAWSLALMLLLVVAVRALAARGWRRPEPAELLLAFGFGLALCSLAQAPPPWSELARLTPSEATRIYDQVEAHAFVDRVTERGEHVAILIPMGHRIAYDLGLVNVSPYGFMDEIVTRHQMDTMLDALREERAHKLFVLEGRFAPAHRRVLRQAGLTERDGQEHYDYWADASVPR